MSSVVILVGGAADGVELTVDDEPPPPVLFAAEPPRKPSYIEALPPFGGQNFTTLAYTAICDNFGHVSRDDRGRWRYQYRPEGRRP